MLQEHRSRPHKLHDLAALCQDGAGRIAVDDQLRVLVHPTEPEQHAPTTPSQASIQ